MSKDGTEGVSIGTVDGKSKAVTGKPRKFATSFMRTKIASPGGFPGGGFTDGVGANFYSPELSPDFLELPQNLDEQRHFFRFFYQSDPFVGQAIDLHTEIPLSKIRLGMAKCKNRELAEKSLRFCERWAKNIGLLHRLIEVVHEYYLIGEVFIFCEDNSPDMPNDIRYDTIHRLNEDTGEVTEHHIEREDADLRAVSWLKENYQGWTAIRIL